MPKRSIAYCQNRKKPAKNSRKAQERARPRRKPRHQEASAGALWDFSEDAIAMEDFLNLACIGAEFLAALDGEIARPRQIDVDDSFDFSRPGRDHADAGRELDRLFDAVGYEDDSRAIREPECLQVAPDSFTCHRIELAQGLIEQ